MQQNEGFLFVEFIEGQPVEILRVGEFIDRRGKEVVITESDLDEFVAKFRAGATGQDVPVDIQHERAEAAGWVRSIRREGDRLLGDVDWNSLGQKLIGEKIYRYLSATIDMVQKAIKSVSLVNFPAVKGLQPVELSEGVFILQESESRLDMLIARIAALIKEAFASPPPTEQVVEEAEFTIRHEGGKWVLYSKDGKKVLGRFDTEEEAKKRERQIQYFKHAQGGEHSTESDIELRKHHTAAWHRCWDKLKPKFGDQSAAAICTWSVKRPPNPPNVYAEEGDEEDVSVTVLTLDEAMEIDELLAAAMEAQGIVALRINLDTWDVKEITIGESSDEEESGMSEQELKELREQIRQEIEAELEQQDQQVSELREKVRKEVEAEMQEKYARRQELAEFAEEICGSDGVALSAKPDDVVEFLVELSDEQLETAKSLLKSKVVDFGERGSSRDGKGDRKELPKEYADALDKGEMKVSDLSDPILDLGELSEYDLSKWQE